MSAYKIIKPDVNAVCIDAATHLISLAKQCIAARGEFTIALAGGSTPKSLFKVLSKPPYSTLVPWGKLRIFFGDERDVPPTHSDSNYGMANKYLFKYINIDPTRIHRIQSELGAETAAEAYHLALGANLPLNKNKKPVFDLILLGLGDDGHVASLFPGTDILNEQEKNAAAVWVESKKCWRTSITLPVINSAREVWLLVTGESKHNIIDRIFNYPSGFDALPVELVKPDKGVTWYLDEAAASWLK